MAEEKKDEGKPLTDKDLEGIQGGIIVQSTPKTINPIESVRTEWSNPPDPILPGSK